MARKKDTIPPFVKQDLIMRVASKTPYTEACIRNVLDAVFESIVEMLVSGRGLRIRNFGAFVLRHRKAGSRKNPTTGEMVHYPARRAPAFKPGRDVIQAVREGDSSCSY